MPNRPAKNISSLDSQMIVPTLTMLGRFNVWIRALNAAGPGGGLVAVVTRGLWPAGGDHALAGSFGGSQGSAPLAPSVMSNPVLLVYSHRREVRDAIITAIGRRPAPDVGRVDYLECSGVNEVMMATDAQSADVLILDGEAQPTGGI